MGTLAVGLETVLGSVLRVLDEGGKCVGGTDGVLAGDDGNGLRSFRPLVDALGDHGGDELENVGTHGAGDSVGSGDLLDEIGLVSLGVDGAVICDDAFCGTLGSDLNDLVRRSGVNLVDQGVGNVSEDDFVSGVVKEAGDESTSDIASTKVDSLLAGDSHDGRSAGEGRLWVC